MTEAEVRNPTPNPSRLAEIRSRLAKAIQAMNPCELLVDSTDLRYLLDRLEKAEAVCQATERLSNAMVIKEDAPTGPVAHPMVQTLEPEIGYAVHDVRRCLTAWAATQASSAPDAQRRR